MIFWCTLYYVGCYWSFASLPRIYIYILFCTIFFQDHNYGAPPPPTPPPSPGSNALVTKNKSFEIALKSLKPNKTVPEKRTKAPIKRRVVRRNAATKATVVKPVADESEPVVVTNTEQQENDESSSTGDYSDSITRCICNFTHDDGYMICCDQCQ